MTIQFDFSATYQFLALLEGRKSVEEVFNHPAYQAVLAHSHKFGVEFSLNDVEKALSGEPSVFFGLTNLSERLPDLLALLKTLEQFHKEWCAIIEQELRLIAPKADQNITIYPIIGYDMGIGIDGVVCMNLNVETYLENPIEFLFYAVHECVHVLYERHHDIPALKDVNTPEQWRSYLNLWTQNEGFAVYGALRLRERLGGLQERDYQVLTDPTQLDIHRKTFLENYHRLIHEKMLRQEDYLEICFGDMRLTYRIGCELLRRVENKFGSVAIHAAFLMDHDQFMDQYLELLLA